MDVVDHGLESKLNSQSFKNMNLVAYKDPTSVMDLDLEDKEFMAKLKWVIDN